jgi:hypothetical protein
MRNHHERAPMKASFAVVTVPGFLCRGSLRIVAFGALSFGAVLWTAQAQERDDGGRRARGR